MGLPKRLLIATDYSGPAEQACEVGIELARRCDAEVHWVHGVEHLPGELPPRADPLLRPGRDRPAGSADRR